MSSSTRPNPAALLRPFPPTYPSLAHPSDVLVPTEVPARSDPRAHFLSSASTSSTPPPIIARSPFVPLPLVDHLMRNKRDSAITTKYLPGTAITNAEAVLHSFVTALVKVKQCADYAWQNGHSAVPLGLTSDGKYRLARPFVLSTSLHNDFEDAQVAERFFAVEREAVVGRDLLASGNFRVPSVEEKNDPVFRAQYDHSLKQHAVFHLLPSRRLPSFAALPNPAWTVPQTVSFLRSYLSAPLSSSSTTPLPSSLLQDRFLLLLPSSSPSPPTTLSLCLLYLTYLHSLSNELSALEALTGPGGYAYTYDPPSIFARRLPNEVSTLLTICALREIVLSYPGGVDQALPRMRLFALTDYTPLLSSLLPLLRLSLPSHIPALSRTSLFPPPLQTLAPPSLLPELNGATLVVHNNSDAFGQNVESEESGGSVDGVVGSWGDGARGLNREREDLCRLIG
ncbi:hypothetical protein JCM11251_002104 [Rhodosporidiobolus azoricus]